VNVSALPKARVNVEEFLGWAEPQPGDVDTKFIDGVTVTSVGPCVILFPERRAIVDRERNATGNTESPIVQDGETALDPPVATLLWS
jgi:hypothetical protein